MPSLLLNKNREHMPGYTSMISSWVRKVLSIAKPFMPFGTLQGAVVSAALAAGVSQVSILQKGDWVTVSTPT